MAGGNVEAEYHEEIYRLTIIDALTETHNKRYLMEFLDRELARSARHHRPLALILFDIDRFKPINDEHGHLGGDFTLRELAACVKSIIRKEELFGKDMAAKRFAIVLPESTLEVGLRCGQNAFDAAGRESPHFMFEGRTFPVTISLGVACTTGDESLTPGELIRQTDEKLYNAETVRTQSGELDSRFKEIGESSLAALSMESTGPKPGGRHVDRV